MPKSGNIQTIRDEHDVEETLIREALVGEIAEADRWVAVVKAWQALIHVRIMAGNLRAERIAAAQSTEPDVVLVHGEVKGGSARANVG